MKSFLTMNLSDIVTHQDLLPYYVTQEELLKRVANLEKIITKMQAAKPEVISLREAAYILGVTEETVRKMGRRKDIVRVKKNRKEYQYTRESIYNFRDGKR
jgi:hypothetical protein